MRICLEFNGQDMTGTSLGGRELDEARWDKELEVAGVGCLLQNHCPVVPYFSQRHLDRPRCPQAPHQSCAQRVNHQTEFLGDRLSAIEMDNLQSSISSEFIDPIIILSYLGNYTVWSRPRVVKLLDFPCCTAGKWSHTSSPVLKG